MIKIFYGDNDNRDYNNPDAYAFLNWRMDNGLGSNDKENRAQMASDNYQMGKGYIGNALVSLFTIIENNNQNNVADIMVFPILFDAWHGLELWLKSLCISLSLLYGETVTGKLQGHSIEKFYSDITKFLDKYDLKQVKEVAFSDLCNLINEFKRVNANFDFARYSFSSKAEYQFYNAPYEDVKQWQNKSGECDKKIVPNTCVKLTAAFELISNIFDNVGTLTEALILALENGDVLTDSAYLNYLDSINKFKTELNKSDNRESITILLEEIS